MPFAATEPHGGHLPYGTDIFETQAIADRVILIVLESVGARWTSLHSTLYDNTTPSLVAESANGLIFDNFYAHIGRSSNSLAAMLMSTYTKLDFRDITDEYPQLTGTSLATVFERRGYRTTFITPSDLSWAGWTIVQSSPLWRMKLSPTSLSA